METTCVRVENDELGRWLVSFDDGSGFEFPDFNTMKTTVDQVSSPDNTRLALIGWWLARSSDGSNVNLILNKTITFDFNNPNPIRVQ